MTAEFELPRLVVIVKIAPAKVNESAVSYTVNKEHWEHLYILCHLAHRHDYCPTLNMDSITPWIVQRPLERGTRMERQCGKKGRSSGYSPQKQFIAVEAPKTQLTPQQITDHYPFTPKPRMKRK